MSASMPELSLTMYEGMIGRPNDAPTTMHTERRGDYDTSRPR